jgi:hypothetical protein
MHTYTQTASGMCDTLVYDENKWRDLMGLFSHMSQMGFVLVTLIFVGQLGERQLAITGKSSATSLSEI